MNDREKLIELIEKWNKDEFAISYASDELADYLIANGVVIQNQSERFYQDGRLQFSRCTNCRANNFRKDGTYCPNCGAKIKEVT